MAIDYTNFIDTVNISQTSTANNYDIYPCKMIDTKNTQNANYYIATTPLLSQNGEILSTSENSYALLLDSAMGAASDSPTLEISSTDYSKYSMLLIATRLTEANINLGDGNYAGYGADNGWQFRTIALPQITSTNKLFSIFLVNGTALHNVFTANFSISGGKLLITPQNLTSGEVRRVFIKIWGIM